MSTDTELETRLRELEDPINQGQALDAGSFIKLVVVALAIPVVMLIVGWVVM